MHARFWVTFIKSMVRKKNWLSKQLKYHIVYLLDLYCEMSFIKRGTCKKNLEGLLCKFAATNAGLTLTITLNKIPILIKLNLAFF